MKLEAKQDVKFFHKATMYGCSLQAQDEAHRLQAAINAGAFPRLAFSAVHRSQLLQLLLDK
ncbi:MAG: hypothetical protein R3E79_51670 [Caldilineaceae bacterium]